MHTAAFFHDPSICGNLVILDESFLPLFSGRHFVLPYIRCNVLFTFSVILYGHKILIDWSDIWGQHLILLK